MAKVLSYKAIDKAFRSVKGEHGTTVETVTDEGVFKAQLSGQLATETENGLLQLAQEQENAKLTAPKREVTGTGGAVRVQRNVKKVEANALQAYFKGIFKACKAPSASEERFQGSEPEVSANGK